MAAQIHRLGRLPFQIGTNSGDYAIFYPDIGGTVDIVFRVDDMTALKQHIVVHAGRSLLKFA